MTPWYMRKPVIASVQGHALGGGCELAMFCDITIAADNAIFGEPEIHFSNVGPAIVMPWMIGFKKARELLYFGDMIDAETALQLGMINRIVPLAELQDKTLRFAKRMALISPEALTHTKLAINRGADAMGFTDAMHAGLDVVAPLYAAKSDRRKVCAPPSNGGAISSRNTRTDVTEDEVIRELSRKARELLQKMIAREVSGAVCRAVVLAEVTISSSCGRARHPGPGGYGSARAASSCVHAGFPPSRSSRRARRGSCRGSSPGAAR